MSKQHLGIVLPRTAGKLVRSHMREQHGIKVSGSTTLVPARLAVVVTWEGRDVVVPLPHHYRLQAPPKRRRSAPA